MRKLKQWLILGVLVAPMATWLIGCSSSNTSSGGSSNSVPPVGSREVVDLAVADRDFESVMNASEGFGRVVLFLDVLNDVLGNLQDPNVVLDQTGSGIDGPRWVLLTSDGDLLVGDDDDTELNVFRDYAALSDGDAPTFSLTSAGLSSLNGIGGSLQALVNENDDLVVADGAEVKIWHDFSADVAETAPDAILDTATSLIDNAENLWVAGDNLWVANWNGDGTGVTDEETVLLFNDVSGIAAAVAPDGILEQHDSFFDFGFPAKYVYVDPVTNVLYVTVNDDTAGDDNALFAFADADAISAGDLPVTVIAGTGTNLTHAHTVNRFGNRIYVANRNIGNGSECKNLPGVVGFDVDLSTGQLATGQHISVGLFGDNGLAAAQTIESVNSWFFAGGMTACQDFEGFGDVVIFWGGNGGPLTDDSPVITLPALKDFATPVDIATRLRN